MKVNVVGTRKRSGTSKKTGNPYNCVDLFFTYPASGCVGLMAGEKALFDSDLETFPVINTIKPGDIVNLDYGPTGYLVGIEIVGSSGAPASPLPPKSGGLR